MRAEIIAIGTEILLGELQDANSRFLAQRLPPLGIDCYYMHQVGDNVERLRGTIATALSRSDVVLCTGGLGPTDDDVTREAIAAALDEPLTLDDALVTTVRAFFAGRGYPMPEQNLKQAQRIPSATALPNPRGTAPGWWVERGGKIVIAMPGPPAELSGMWEDAVRPRLAERSPDAALVSRTLKTVGMGESLVDEAIRHLAASANPTIGVYAKGDGVHLRLTAKARTAADARALIAPLETQVRAALGHAVWGADDDTLAAAVQTLLRDRGWRVATMESCTGGLLGHLLTDVPGASATFAGGLVTYTAEAKQRYGVPAATIAEAGLVSEPTARAMAEAVRAQFETEVGIGITGVAGPEPHDGAPVGSVQIAVATPDGTTAVGFVFPQTRSAVKQRAATVALAQLRQRLLDAAPVPPTNGTSA